MADLDLRVMQSMASRYQQGLSRVQIAAEAAATDAWFGLGSVSEDDEERWRRAYWLVVFSAALAAASLARSYLRAQGNYLGVVPELPNVDMGWLESDFDKWWRSPITRTRWLISEGSSWDEAMRVTGDGMVVSQTSAVVRVAEQESVEQILNSVEWETSWEYVEERPDEFTFPSNASQAAAHAERTSARPRKDSKFKRVPQGGACGWCLVVADRLYTTSTYEKWSRRGQQWHVKCRCTWRMATPDEARTFEPQFSGGDWRDVIDQRATTPATNSGDEL